MASINQIINLSDDLVRYLKACGKKSVLQTKPITYTDLKGLRYAPELKADTFVRKVETWMTSSDHVAPLATKETMVAGHHNFHAVNSYYNTSLEKSIEGLERLKKVNPKRYQERIKEKILDFEYQTKELLEQNIKFTELTPQPKDCIAYRGTMRYIGESRQDFDIINAASIGDTIVPTRGFAYGAHYKMGTYKYLGGGPYDYKGNLTFENMMIEYRIPKGAQISSNMEHEGEVVFPALSKFKLLSKDTRLIEKLVWKGDIPIVVGSHPYKHVVLEYIPEIPL